MNKNIGHPLVVKYTSSKFEEFLPYAHTWVRAGERGGFLPSFGWNAHPLTTDLKLTTFKDFFHSFYPSEAKNQPFFKKPKKMPEWEKSKILCVVLPGGEIFYSFFSSSFTMEFTGGPPLTQGILRFLRHLSEKSPYVYGIHKPSPLLVSPMCGTCTNLVAFF